MNQRLIKMNWKLIKNELKFNWKWTKTESKLNWKWVKIKIPIKKDCNQG